MRIAFAGNPNSGKTTMYNALTGKHEHVGNWAGVTVDKKESSIRTKYSKGERLIAVDLPGTYSISPFTSEEGVTRDYIINERPDVLINIVDATNLSRSLFFTTQLLELGLPTVIALNKADINQKNETVIDTSLLSKKLGCPVIDTIAADKKSKGLEKLIEAVIDAEGKPHTPIYKQDASLLTDKASAIEADKKRYEYVNSIVEEVERRKVHTSNLNNQDKFDALITHRWLGIPIFAVVMFLVFQISQAWLGPFLAEYLVGWIDSFKEWVAASLEGGNVFLVSLLTEGIIGGVSAVVGFLPLVMVMYFLIALLEDCGYMARVSVVLDPIFKKVGLSGRSVIPFVIGTGCAVPGVMSCRTIRSERERRATAMLTPFMPCGAKLPVIALFAGAFFKGASWVGTLMYFMSILIIFLAALLVNKITAHKSKHSFFIIELPQYKLPSAGKAFLSMLERGKSYIIKAGTVILLCNAVVFIMQSFNWHFSLVSEDAASTSILASIAKPLTVLLIPIGIKAWQMTAAVVTGFIAKENVVGTLAVCYGISNMIDTEELSMVAGNEKAVAATLGISSVAALAYLMFNLFSPPCFAALGAMSSELKSKKWFVGGIALQLGVGYTAAYLVYTIGTLITVPSSLPVIPALIGLGIILVMIGYITFLIKRNQRKEDA